MTTSANLILSMKHNRTRSIQLQSTGDDKTKALLECNLKNFFLSIQDNNINDVYDKFLEIKKMSALKEEILFLLFWYPFVNSKEDLISKLIMNTTILYKGNKIDKNLNFQKLLQVRKGKKF